MSRGSRVLTVVAIVVTALALSFVPAASVAPVAGATYEGQVTGAPQSENAVSFTVSENGRWVTHLRVGEYPMTLGCGSGGDPPEQSSHAVRIRHGAVTAQVVYKAGEDVVNRTTVTGTFLRRGKEKGVVASHIVGTPASAWPRPYTTHAR